MEPELSLCNCARTRKRKGRVTVSQERRAKEGKSEKEAVHTGRVQRSQVNFMPTKAASLDASLAHYQAVADSGGVRGCKCTPLWQLVMYFCVNSCTSPSNDYTAVECSNNDQAQLNTHVSVPY